MEIGPPRQVHRGTVRRPCPIGRGRWLNLAAEVVIVVMTVTTLADAKTRFFEIVASAEVTHERTTITKNGRPPVVVIADEHLESLKETLAIMSTRKVLSAVRDRAGEPAEPISKDDMLARIAARQACATTASGGPGHAVPWAGFHSRSRLRSWSSSTVFSLRIRSESGKPLRLSSPASAVPAQGATGLFTRCSRRLFRLKSSPFSTAPTSTAGGEAS